ncbi:GDSL-type esterase/lipase family protein [Paucilactobacillus kaifaensis]|uniref:GDSL-type esterase/lipase family protein n=1 Tax=Paucilactobacillus kaifaensis TaxID=2559921 RepID=UPI001484F8AF|nr:GDSL-type esterase/lipase family protein [Paucilactobacillus kaifaensis]
MLTKKLSPLQIITKTSLIGRWIIKPIHHVDTLYSTNLGSLIKFDISNSLTLAIDFFNNGNPFGPSQIVAVRIDHQNWQRFLTNQMPQSISLTEQEHTVELMLVGNSDLDEVWTGNQGFALKSISVDQTAIIKPNKHNQPVTFIGDSITSGCWINGHHASFDYAAESNYVAVCADQLHLDATRISYSAAGILNPGTGGVPNATVFLDHIDATTKWQSQPTTRVIINIGVNDRHFTRSDFNQALPKFIEQVQILFPAVPISIMIPFSQTYAPIFRTTVQQMGNIQLIETKDWHLSYTDGLHPDATGSYTAGILLAKALKYNY